MKEEIQTEQENLSEQALEQSEIDAYAKKMLDLIEQGGTLRDLHGIPKETMRDIYKYAYDFYVQGKLDEAESLFRFLCVYDFYNPEYPMGMGAVCQLKKNYAKALDFYALAYSLSKEDYRPMFYAGQCNLQLRRVQKARRCFEIVLERCQDGGLVSQSEVYLAAIAENREPKAGEQATEEM